MLSLPVIKDLIKSRDTRKQTADVNDNLFTFPGGHAEVDLPACALHLAKGLDIDILAIIEVADNPRSATMMAAGKQGLACELTIPSFESRGTLSRLISDGKPAGGTAKIFASDEVFPCDATWCDFIPMDSSVPYFFVPLKSLPLVGNPGENSGGSTRFVLVASADKAGENSGLGLKAVAVAGLVGRFPAAAHSAESPETFDPLKALLVAEGYSICLATAEGQVIERTGGLFDEIGFYELTRVLERAAGFTSVSSDTAGGPYDIALQGAPEIEAVVYPVMLHDRTDGFLVVLKRRRAPQRHDTRNERLGLLSRFMSSIAHEIKNPLTGIAAGVQYLAKKLQPGATEDDTVAFVLAEISRLNRIVDDLYRIAKPPDLVPGNMNINDVVAKSLLSMSEEVLKKKISIEQDLRTDIPQFEADADRLQQVLVNIIKNAVEASSDMGKIYIQTAQEGPKATVRITDYGSGIPEEEWERVFEPFYSTKKAGTGLGLCVSQRIIEQHGGRIFIETAEMGGTAFVIELPVRS
jgi:signal transduction histidine kinase